MAAIKSAPVPKPDPSNKPSTITEGNQLDTGVKAQSLPPMPLLGTIGPANADGSFRDVQFAISPALVKRKDRLILRIIRLKGKVSGVVSEVRVLKD